MVPGDHSDPSASLAKAADLVVLDTTVQGHNADTALGVEHPWLLPNTTPDGAEQRGGEERMGWHRTAALTPHVLWINFHSNFPNISSNLYCMNHKTVLG